MGLRIESREGTVDAGLLARVERLEITNGRLLDMIMHLTYEHLRLLNMLTLMAAQPKEGERTN